jgi:RNA polymerase sigma-70 factor (ECF subfamily)
VVPTDERALVGLLQSGDPEAPRLLIERYQGPVFGLCFRMMGHRHDAEDVMQETFLRAVRAISGFDIDRPVGPWLVGIAANRCRTARSRRGRCLPLAETVDERVDHCPARADPDDLAGEIERALDLLRPEYRLVFTLFHEQNLPYEEIGQAIGRPVGTVRSRLHRARAELACHLGGRGVHC